MYDILSKEFFEESYPNLSDYIADAERMGYIDCSGSGYEFKLIIAALKKYADCEGKK